MLPASYISLDVYRPLSLSSFFPSFVNFVVLNTTHTSLVSLAWNLDFNEPQQLHLWFI